MNKAFVLCVLALSTLGLGGCVSMKVVEPGQQGVLVDIAGSDEGSLELVTGRKWVNNYSQRLLVFSVTEQTKVWTNDLTEDSPIPEGITVNTKEGSVVGLNVGITYRIVDSAKFAQTFRKEDEEVINQNVRTALRNALSIEASKLTVYELIGSERENMLLKVQERLNEDYLGTPTNPGKGMEIINVAIVGSPTLPPSVQDAINKTLEAKARTEESRAKLNQAKVDQDVARIDAETKKLEAAGNVPSALELKQLELQAKYIDKWNGALPNTIVTFGADNVGDILFPKPNSNMNAPRSNSNPASSSSQ
jgi:regulator of protease activity HflC (stomatin/prohibitin superfamily)